MFRHIVFILVVILLSANCQVFIGDLENEKVLYPCDLDTNIVFSEFSKSDEGEYDFYLFMKLKNKRKTFILAKFATPTFFNSSDALMEFSVSRQDTLYIYVVEKKDDIMIRLKTVNGMVPEIESIVVDNVERCKKNLPAIQQVNLMELFGNSKAALSSKITSLDCGQRKIDHTSLISSGLTTKRGEWPWHVALNKRIKNSVSNICGGTLISKTVVLTAAHCVTEYNVALQPNSFIVQLGKHNLASFNEDIQVKEVLEIKVHEKFNHITLEYDVALLFLKTQAKFNDFVQPACLWPQKPNLLEKIALENYLGTVVGWGLNHSEYPVEILQKATFPRVNDLKCIKSNSLYFVSALNEQSFCAGWGNDTSACKGDSGGGFHVFVPDDPDDSTATAPGRWYVQGLVSQTAIKPNTNQCDSKNYVIFTDVVKMMEWIKENTLHNI